MSVVFSNHFFHESPYFPDINFDIHRQWYLWHLDYDGTSQWQWKWPPKQKARALETPETPEHSQQHLITCGVLTAADMNKSSNLSWKTSCKTNSAINSKELCSLKCTAIKILPLDLWGVSHRITWKTNKAVYSLKFWDIQLWKISEICKWYVTVYLVYKYLGPNLLEMEFTIFVRIQKLI